MVAVRNRLLAGLSRKEYARILPDLARVTLNSGQVMYEPGSVMPVAYFLETAIVRSFRWPRTELPLEVKRGRR